MAGTFSLSEPTIDPPLCQPPPLFVGLCLSSGLGGCVTVACTSHPVSVWVGGGGSHPVSVWGGGGAPILLVCVGGGGVLLPLGQYSGCSSKGLEKHRSSKGVSPA